MLTSSTQLQNRSFHVVERTRTSSKCHKMKNARAKRAKMLFFIVKYANLWGFCCWRRRRGCLSSLKLSGTKQQRRRQRQRKRPLKINIWEINGDYFLATTIICSLSALNCDNFLFLTSFIVDGARCKWTGRSAVKVNIANGRFPVVCSGSC